MLLRNRLAALLLIATVQSACAQYSATPSPAPNPKLLAFEVASIHPHAGPLRTEMGYTASGPHLRLEGDNLRLLIMEAYSLKYYQVALPKSIAESDVVFYDVVAAAPEGSAPTRDDFRHMLQALLADRFQLKAHFEKKDTPVYALVIAKGGPKFSASTENGTGWGGVNGRSQFFDAKRIIMPELAEQIYGAFLSDRPIIDRTGLTGAYKLRIEATPEWRMNRDPQPGDLSIFTAVQEQLGLKLEPSTAPLDVLIVDSVQKPSEN